MFRRLFQFSSSENEIPMAGRNPSTVTSSGMVELSNALQREAQRPGNGVVPIPAGVPPVLENFEEVYSSAGIKEPGKTYTILKVAEMVNSRYLAEMSPDDKRNSLIMALEAAEVPIGDLLQDAVTRNRALDAYEGERQDHIKRFETAKAEENNRLHAELERLTGQYMTKIQANSDEVAQEQDNFRAWQKRKQLESQRITDAATVCVPQGNAPVASANTNTLNSVLDRVHIPRR